jgi:hypothetical protein
MQEIIELVGVVLRGLEVILKVLDLIRENRREKSRNRPQ